MILQSVHVIDTSNAWHGRSQAQEVSADRQTQQRDAELASFRQMKSRYLYVLMLLRRGHAVLSQCLAEHALQKIIPSTFPSDKLSYTRESNDIVHCR